MIGCPDRYLYIGGVAWSPNGAEFVVLAVADWCRFNDTDSVFIDPGSPGQNAWIEPFNGKFRDDVSYLLYYHLIMAQRQKRSISLPPELADAIDQAAAAEGTTVSAWIADTAAHRLRLDAGRRGIAEWEWQHGALTAEELADGLARARAVLGRPASKRKAS